MPTPPNTPSPGERFRSWDGKRTGTAADANRRTEIEERIKQRKPLRKADVAFLRDVLHISVMVRNGKDLLA